MRCSDLRRPTALAALATVAFLAANGSANAHAGDDVFLCGQAHRAHLEWTVEVIVATTENPAHPDVSCTEALRTVKAIDGGKGAADERTRSPASGEPELIYRSWTCTIDSRYSGDGHGTFMARIIHGNPTVVDCYDGKVVSGVSDEISYWYGIQPALTETTRR